MTREVFLNRINYIKRQYVSNYNRWGESIYGLCITLEHSVAPEATRDLNIFIKPDGADANGYWAGNISNKEGYISRMGYLRDFVKLALKEKLYRRY